MSVCVIEGRNSLKSAFHIFYAVFPIEKGTFYIQFLKLVLAE